MNGLTPHQKIFSALCQRLDIPNTQIAICLSIFTQEELKEILDWVSQETKAKQRLLEDYELTKKINQMVRDRHYDIKNN